MHVEKKSTCMCQMNFISVMLDIKLYPVSRKTTYLACNKGHLFSCLKKQDLLGSARGGGGWEWRPPFTLKSDQFCHSKVFPQIHIHVILRFNSYRIHITFDTVTVICILIAWIQYNRLLKRKTCIFGWVVINLILIKICGQVIYHKNISDNRSCREMII